MMDFNKYQERAKETAIYPQNYKLIYPAMGLAGEGGEVANKVKKLMRDKGMVLDDKDRESIVQELGDVLWYVAAVATDIGWDLEGVALMNIKKLESRMTRGVVSGSGDNR